MQRLMLQARDEPMMQGMAPASALASARESAQGRVMAECRNRFLKGNRRFHRMENRPFVLTKQWMGKKYAEA